MIPQDLIISHGKQIRNAVRILSILGWQVSSLASFRDPHPKIPFPKHQTNLSHVILPKAQPGFPEYCLHQVRACPVSLVTTNLAYWRESCKPTIVKYYSMVNFQFENFYADFPHILEVCPP